MQWLFLIAQRLYTINTPNLGEVLYFICALCTLCNIGNSPNWWVTLKGNKYWLNLGHHPLPGGGPCFLSTTHMTVNIQYRVSQKCYITFIPIVLKPSKCSSMKFNSSGIDHQGPFCGKTAPVRLAPFYQTCTTSFWWRDKSSTARLLID